MLAFAQLLVKHAFGPVLVRLISNLTWIFSASFEAIVELSSLSLSYGTIQVHGEYKQDSVKFDLCLRHIQPEIMELKIISPLTTIWSDLRILDG